MKNPPAKSPDLTRYFHWCLQEIQLECTTSLKRLRLITTDPASTALRFLSQANDIAPAQLFDSLLARQLHSIYGSSSGNSLRVDEAVVSRYERFAIAEADRISQQPISTAFLARATREGRNVLRLVRAEFKKLGHRLQRIATSAEASTTIFQSCRVVSYFRVQPGAFCYWQDVHFSDAHTAIVRESFMARFGLGTQTIFRDLESPGAELVAEFVAREASRFLAFVEQHDPDLW